MKLIEEKKKTEIVLSEKEIIEVTCMQGNIKMVIQCLGNTLHVKEVTKDGHRVEDEEAKAIKAMKEDMKMHKEEK